jgi:hypothetical protein
MRLLTLVILGATGAVLSIAVMPAVRASAAGGTDDNALATLQKLYATVPVAKTIGEKARAVLVFPSIVKAGLIIGGQYGEGGLVKDGRIVGHYNSVAASYGLQAGAQKFGYALFLMNDKAVEYLDNSEGWEIGVGPSIVIVNEEGENDDNHNPAGRCVRLQLRPEGPDGGSRHPGLEDHQAFEIGSCWVSARRTGGQLGPDHAGQGLEHDSATLRTAAALVRQELEAGRFRTGEVSDTINLHSMHREREKHMQRVTAFAVLGLALTIAGTTVSAQE